MKFKISTIVVVAILVAGIALAQDVLELERILIPIYTEEPIEGAAGSLWTTELALLVGGEEDVFIDGYRFSPCELTPCIAPDVPPGLTFYPSIGETHLQGTFIRAEAIHSQNVRAQLRARDLSRQDDDWGAEIPAIHESSAPVGSFDILDIPADDRYRVMLRIYHFDDGDVPVTVRLYETRPSQRIANSQVPLDQLISETNVLVSGGNISVPGYAQIENLSVPAPFDSGRLRIEVMAESDARLWGFVTITNNATQHVTVASPQ